MRRICVKGVRLDTVRALFERRSTCLLIIGGAIAVVGAPHKNDYVQVCQVREMHNVNERT